MDDLRKLKPLLDLIVIERDKPETTTASGLHIPESSQKETMTGVILSVGPGRWLFGKFIKPKVKPKTRVLFRAAAAANKTDDVVIIHEDDLLGVLPKRKPA